MSGAIRCPNPACSYMFPAEIVRYVPKLVCPGCGHTFEPRTSFSRESPASAGPKPSSPIAHPPSPASPRPTIVPAPSSHRRRLPPWQLLVLVLLLVGGCGLFTVGGAILLAWKNRSAGTASSRNAERGFVFVPEDESFRFTSKLPDWRKAPDDAEKNLSPTLVMQRKDPSSTMAILVHDFRGRIPSEEVLKETTGARLQAGFKDFKRSYQSGTLAGKDALRTDFQAHDANGDFVVGQSYCVLHRATAIWLVTWRQESMPEEVQAKVEQEWQELRDGLVLQDSGEPDNVKKTAFHGHHGDRAAYVLDGLAKLWKENPQPQDDDVDLALFARDLALGPGKRDAELRVRLLAGSLDGQKAVDAEKKRIEEMLKKRWKDEAIDKVEIETLGEVKQTAVGKNKEPCQVLRLRVAVPQRQFDAFFRVVLLPKRDLTIAFECECDWSSQQIWEADFEQLLNSLR